MTLTLTFHNLLPAIFIPLSVFALTTCSDNFVFACPSSPVPCSIRVTDPIISDPSGQRPTRGNLLGSDRRGSMPFGVARTGPRTRVLPDPPQTRFPSSSKELAMVQKPFL